MLDLYSPLETHQKHIIAGQQSGEIVEVDPVILSVTYYSFIQGFAINKIQWPECPTPDANLIMKIFSQII